MGLKDIVDKLSNTYFAWSFFAASKTGDCISTIYGLENIPNVKEGNPMASFLLDTFGLYGGIAAYGLWSSGIALACYGVLRRNYTKNACNFVPLTLGAVSTACVINNLTYICQ